MNNHYATPPAEYTGGSVKLPSPEEIPNIDMAVVNYHRPLLGTFHAKFMIVDRQYAIVQSNNIMDNDNTEMGCQYEWTNRGQHLGHIPGLLAPCHDAHAALRIRARSKQAHPFLPSGVLHEAVR